MRTLDPVVADWIEQSISAKLPFKLYEDWIFNPAYKKLIKNQLPPGASRRDYPFVYLSNNRPISLVWAKELSDCLVVTTESGTKSYVASHEPLDPQILYRLELMPLSSTRGATLFSILEPGDFPLTMARQDRTGKILAAVAGPDPSRPAHWRVTYFEEDVGPTGHTEVADPLAAIQAMIDNGYTELAQPTLVDELF